MEAFYSQWIAEEERHVRDLLSVPPNRPDLQIPLISRVLSHYNDYYDRLFRLANRDIFLVLSAYWLTPIERSFIWLGGLKPDILFRFTSPDINEDQRREMEKLKQQTVQRERELEEVMQEVEVTMTALVNMTALHGNARNGEARAMAETRAIDITHSVFYEANRLRKHVVSRKLKILNTTQAVQFLALVGNHQILIHQFGLQHMAQV
jgi:Seed dormancy control